jgi:hypothetical protein
MGVAMRKSVANLTDEGVVAQSVPIEFAKKYA